MFKPLEYNQKDQVSEYRPEKEDLGKEFCQDAHGNGSTKQPDSVPELSMVEALQRDPKTHLNQEEGDVRSRERGQENRRYREYKTYMNDSKYNSHLHLVRISKNQRVFRAMPCRINTESIRTTLILFANPFGGVGDGISLGFKGIGRVH